VWPPLVLRRKWLAKYTVKPCIEFRSSEAAGREYPLVAGQRRPGDGSERPVSEAQLPVMHCWSAMAGTSAGQRSSIEHTYAPQLPPATAI